MNFLARQDSSSHRKWSLRKWTCCKNKWETFTVKESEHNAATVRLHSHLQIIIVSIILVLSRLQPAIAKWKQMKSFRGQSNLQLCHKHKFRLPLAYMTSVVLSRHMSVKLIITIEWTLAEFTHRMTSETSSFTLTSINFRVTATYMLIQLCLSKQLLLTNEYLS